MLAERLAELPWFRPNLFWVQQHKTSRRRAEEFTLTVVSLLTSEQLFSLSATKDNRMYLCTSRVDSGSVLVRGDWKQGIFPDTNEYRFY